MCELEEIMNATTMTIFAEALADNRDYKNARISGNLVGVKNYRLWANAIATLRMSAYKVAVARHDNMGTTADAKADLSAVYEALHTLLDLIGEVNGAKLNARNCAEAIIAQATRIRTIDKTIEMAAARCEKKSAKEALNADPENADLIEAYEEACEAVKTLEGEAGNCERHMEINTLSGFTRAVELLLGDAIIGQAMKTAEQVAAEEEAKRQERRAKNAAKRAAKKAAQGAAF
jgi:hypothetical protein